MEMFVISTVWRELLKLSGGIDIAKCLQVKCSYDSATISCVCLLRLRQKLCGSSSIIQQVSNLIQIKQKGFL